MEKIIITAKYQSYEKYKYNISGNPDRIFHFL